MARVDVHHREGELAGAERLLGEPQEDDRVLPAGEEKDGAFELGGKLAHDVNRLRLELVEVAEMDRGLDHSCSPHSVRSLSAQRPSRPAPGIVECVSPMDA